MGLGEAVLHLRQLEQFPEGKSFQDHARPTCPGATQTMLPFFFFFLSSGKHPTQAQTPTSKSFIFSPFPGSVACGLGFPSSLVLTPPTTPLLGEPENSRAQAIMAHYGFLTGEASHVKRVAVSLCDGGLCYLGFRPITADPTSFQEHGRKKNDIETLHFWKSRHGPLASGTIPLDPPLA